MKKALADTACRSVSQFGMFMEGQMAANTRECLRSSIMPNTLCDGDSKPSYVIFGCSGTHPILMLLLIINILYIM